MIKELQSRGRETWSIRDITGNISGMCHDEIDCDDFDDAQESLRDLETYLRFIKRISSILKTRNSEQR